MIYTLPFIAAIIGWFTNYLAVKMLFHPKKPINILGLKIQGIFPKKHMVLAERIGRLVAEDLLTVSDIKSILTKPDNISQINKNIEEKIENYLDTTFPEKYPMLAFFVGEKSKVKIRAAMMEEMETMGPEVMEQTVASLESSVDIEQFIRDKVSMFSTDRMEKLIQGILSTEFKFIEYVGAVVGFVVGLVQVVIMLFL